MKKNYIIITLCAFLGVGTLSAQIFDAPLKQKKNNIATETQEGKPNLPGNQQKAPGDIAWSSDFSTPADWTANGPTAAPSGSNYGWTIQTVPDTWYFSSAFNSSSGGNFAHFENGDPTGTPATQHQGGPFTFTYSNTIDLSGVPAPQLSIEQYGAIFFEKQEVQISTDGGSTWTTVLDNSDEEPFTSTSGGIYANAYSKTASIGGVVSANPSNVTIRIFWDGDLNGPNTSYVSYGWFVDDIQIIEGYQNNLKMNTLNYASTSQGMKYSQMPMNHITDMGFGSKIENIGASNQTNTALEVEVSGAGTYTGSSTTPVTINSYAIDSLTVETFTAAAMGTYNILAYPSSDNTLSNNPDDTLTASFDVTQDIYATDYGSNSGSFTSWLNGTGAQSIGNYYETTSADVLYSVDVGIANTTNNNSQVGSIFFTEVYRFNNSTSSFDLVTTADKTLATADLGQVVSLPLNNSVQVAAGEVYLVVAGSSNGNIGITMTGTALEGTVAGYDGATRNGLADPNYPVVRMNFDPVTVADFQADVTSGCSPLTVNFTDLSTSATSWNWSFSGGAPASTQQNPTVTFNTPGTYTVALTVTGPNGTDSKTKSNLIEVADVNLNISSTNPCNGNCDGEASVSANGGNGTYNYLWYPGSQTTQSINGLCSGTYDVVVEDTDGCQDSVRFDLIDPPVISLTVNSTSEDNGTSNGSIDISGSGGVPPLNYSWSGPNGYTSNMQNPTGLEAGVYYLTITDGNGCTLMDSVNVESSVGLTDLELSNVSIYPNPSDDNVTIRLNNSGSEQLTMKIVDVNGKLMLQENIINDKNIDMQSWSSGIYFIQFMNDQGLSKTKKIIKN